MQISHSCCSTNALAKLDAAGICLAFLEGRVVDVQIQEVRLRDVVPQLPRGQEWIHSDKQISKKLAHKPIVRSRISGTYPSYNLGVI